MNKSIFFLIFMSQELLFKEVKTVESICAGCPVNSPIDDEIRKIADWTATQLPKLNCKYCVSNAIYTVQRIENAQTQVVAGMKISSV